MPTYKLTYFNAAGVVEPIRYIFAYANQPFEDNRISYEDWPALKPSTPYGKLPILEIDGRVFTQSIAIARFLANTFGLTGKDEWEAFEADILVDTLKDLRQEILTAFFEKDEKKKEELRRVLNETTFPFYLGKFEKILSSNPSGLLVGSQVTWADLEVAADLATLEERIPEVVKSFPALTEFRNKVENLPGIKAWLDRRPPSAQRPQ